MKNKIVALMMAMTMTAGLLAGCGNANQTNGSEKSSESETQSSVETTETVVEEKGYNGVDNLVVSEEPVTVSVHYTFGSGGAPTGDMPVWQEIAKITGVQMENVANPSIAEEPQSLNTMLASGELPDVIFGSTKNMTPIISQGAFLPLDDLIAEYAPNIQKFLEYYPTALANGTGTDGNLYLLGGTLGGEAGAYLPDQGWYIRMDWIEKLGLKVPTTLEDLEDVLYAFRNNDPNGNGKQDEIPYFHRGKRIDYALHLWDAKTGYYVGDDGKIYHGRAMEEYKRALTTLAKWYDDGIIDPEIFTRGSNARQDLLGNDLGGCTYDWFSSTGSMNDTVGEMVPGINFAAIAPPENINGEVQNGSRRAAVHQYSVAISATCEDPVTVIKFLDFCYTETASMLLTAGIEGVDYTIENGVFTPSEHALTSHSGGYANYLRTQGCYEFSSYGNVEIEKAGMNPTAAEGFALYAENPQWLEFDWVVPTMTYTEEEQKVFDECKANIDTSVKEYEQSVLLGNIDITTTWDKHLEELNSLGLQKVLDAYNSAYQRYLDAMK